MSWLQSLDVALFRFINETLSNPFFDGVMPFFSGNSLFVPILIILAAVLVWKDGTRGRLCLVMLALAVCLGDPLIVNTLKHAVGRLRPFNNISDAHVLVGRGGSFSMPSAHSANWFSAAMVLFIYYRRSFWFMLPLAALVGFSRIYNGVHYPGDVLVGAMLGMGYGAALVFALDALWRWEGRRWFPLWFERVPSLTKPGSRNERGRAATEAAPSTVNRQPSIDQHWLRLGYVLIGLLLFARLAYIASGKIELSEDEAYQWLWSKHLAPSYYSKPPLIAYTQFLGTTLWGDREFGVRFFSPVIGAVLSLLLLRFFAREVNARAGFWLIPVASATPLLAVGSILMTVDSISVLFWTAAMLAAWRAIHLDSTKHWLWAGLWLALGVMGKFAALVQPLCCGIFFLLWKPARAQLRRPGPWLALLIGLLGLLPLLVWNSMNGWPTVSHLVSRGGLEQPWKPTLNFFQDFLLAEVALLNPIFFAVSIWAAVAFWRRTPRDARLIYFFCMSVPLMIGCLLWTFRARVQPNWLAPAVLPLLCLTTIYWDSRRRERVRMIKGWLTGGLVLGLAVVIVGHETDLIGRIAGRPLPPKYDPLRRVRSWKETARVVGEARKKLLAEGKPVFIVADHYGLTSLITFYLPDAKNGVPDKPLVYFRSSDKPENQFFFWPGYKERKGQNAIFVQEAHVPQPPPERIQKEFASVTDLGIHDIKYRDRIFHQIQLFECRDLR